ncbi:hypothetical protein CDD83_6382 [Cordyceps sp. RAO-2017]|nr:hypothetical protein CDD83_6382 [Cordyceps sp. RAO-2017]
MILPVHLGGLPSSGLVVSRTWEADASPKSLGDAVMAEPTAKLPGIRCPKCFAQGVEVWVIPGKNCKECGTPCG